MVPNIKAVLFDLDNTLFDHSRAQAESLAEIYKNYSSVFNNTSFDAFYKTYLHNNDIFWKKLSDGEISRWECRYLRFAQTLKDLHIDDAPAVEMTLTYFSIYIHRNYPVDGALSVVKSLRRNNYRLGIISNGFIDVQENKIEQLRIRKYFDAVIMSEHVGVMKPHPDIYHAALDALGCDADECVFVGDTYAVDVIGAADAGLSAVWFNPANAEPPVEDDRHFRSISHLENLLTML